MSKNKTAEISSSVTNFINAVKDETKRKDYYSLIDIVSSSNKCNFFLQHLISS